MVTSQLAMRSLPEKEPVEVSAHTSPTVEIRSASEHLTAVAGLASASGAGSDRHGNEATQRVDRSELRRQVIRRSGGPSGLVIRRVIDDDTLMTAITLAGEVDTDDLREIVPALQVFTKAVASYLAAAGAEVGPAMQSLVSGHRVDGRPDAAGPTREQVRGRAVHQPDVDRCATSGAGCVGDRRGSRRRQCDLRAGQPAGERVLQGLLEEGGGWTLWRPRA